MEEEPLDDEGVDEVLDIFHSLNWRHPSRQNEGAYRAEMDQVKQDIIDQRTQMATFLEKNCKLEEKVGVLQKGLEDSQSEIKRLRTDLESEKVRRTGMEAKTVELDVIIKKVISAVVPLVHKMTAVEKAMQVLEDDRKAREASSPQSDEALQALTTLSNEIQIKFNELEETQSRANGEVRNLKETVKDLYKQTQSKTSEIQQRLVKLNESQGNVTVKLDEFTKTMEGLNQQFQVGFQVRFAEVNENQDVVTEEIENLKKTVEEISQRTQPKPEVQIGRSGGTSADNDDDDDISVIIVEDDDDDEEYGVQEPKLEPENAITLSSVASNMRVSSSNTDNRPMVSSSTKNNHIIDSPITSTTTTTTPTTTSRKPVAHVHDKTKTGWYCSCKRKFSNQEYLKAHLRYYTAEKKFPCSLCGKRFVVVCYLRKHQMGAHKIPLEEAAIRCEKCGKLFQNGLEGWEHFKSCRGGSKGSKTTGTVKKMGKVSSPSISGAAAAPSNVSPKKPVDRHGRDYARHLHCLCGKKFNRFCDLKRHLRHYTAEKKYVCKVCCIGFTLPYRLKEHMGRSSHKKKLLAAATTSGVPEKLHPCLRCGRAFKTSLELGGHVKRVHHLKLKKGIVNLSTATVDADGQQHKMITPSSGQRSENQIDPNRFYCECGKSYSAKQRFIYHLKSIIQGKKLACSLCSARFGVHYELKKHVRKVHKIEYSEGKFACSDCAETFDTRMDFNTHRLAAHDAQA